MIHAHLLDAATIPRVVVDAAPGLDRVTWREIDTEEDIGEDRSAEINAALISDPGYTLDVAKWPEPLPRRIPLDWHRCLERRGTDGLHLNLHQVDAYRPGSYAPSGEVSLDLTPSYSDVSTTRMERDLSWREVRSEEPDATRWIRLDSDNELRGLLGEPLAARWDGATSGVYRFEIPDQSLLTPVDMRLGLDAYDVLDADGEPVESELAGQLLNLGIGRFVLYTRPRRWRWTVWVIAHYANISAFEYFVAEEEFVSSAFIRPPIYPYRHDVLTTSLSTPLIGFYGDALSYDTALDYRYDHSRGGEKLRSEILESQIRTLCYVKLFLFVELAELTLWAWPPQPGEIVLGIGRIDDATGHESRFWLRQKADLESIYPRYVIGVYGLDFWVPPTAP